MKKVAEPVVVKGEVSANALAQCKDMGQAMAAALSMGLY